MPMIHAETVKAVQQLHEDRGVEHRTGEPLGDYFERGLNVSPAKAEAFLEALHKGCSVEQAKRVAGIPTRDRAIRFARTVGAALGRIRKQIAPVSRRGKVPAQAAHPSSIGATEDQMNTSLQVPQHINDYGTKAEDIAGTGEHDSQGG